MKNQTNGKRVLVATGIVVVAVLLVVFGISMFMRILVKAGIRQFDKFNVNLIEETMELPTFPQSKTIQGLTIQFPEDWTTVEYHEDVFVQSSGGEVKGLFQSVEVNLAQFFLKKDQFNERLRKRGITVIKENNLRINSTRMYEYICSYKGFYMVLSVRSYHDNEILLSTWQFHSRDTYEQYQEITKQISLQIL